MGSTSATIHRTTGNVATPQGYAPSTDLYKPIAVREIGSSEYGQEIIPYIVTSSSAIVAQAGDTGGRAKTLGFGETTTRTLTVSTSTDGLSGAVDMAGARYAALEMSTAWTAATITFAGASASGGTFYPVYGATGGEITIAETTASRIVVADTIASALAPLSHIKLRSGTFASPVAQAAERSLTLILKG